MWEARLDASKKPTPSATMGQRESFIRSKYERALWKGEPVRETEAASAEINMSGLGGAGGRTPQQDFRAKATAVERQLGRRRSVEELAQANIFKGLTPASATSPLAESRTALEARLAARRKSEDLLGLGILHSDPASPVDGAPAHAAPPAAAAAPGVSGFDFLNTGTAQQSSAPPTTGAGSPAASASGFSFIAGDAAAAARPSGFGFMHAPAGDAGPPTTSAAGSPALAHDPFATAPGAAAAAPAAVGMAARAAPTHAAAPAPAAAGDFSAFDALVGEQASALPRHPAATAMHAAHGMRAAHPMSFSPIVRGGHASPTTAAHAAARGMPVAPPAPPHAQGGSGFSFVGGRR